jgi:DNA-binding transcriptional MocR family regulator
MSYVLQRLVLHLLRDLAVEDQLRNARETYGARRNALLDELRDRGIRGHGATGLNVWLPVAEEGPVALDLAHRGWVVSPGGAYRQAFPPGVRVTTSPLDVTDAPTLIGDIAEALRPRTARSG